MGEFWKLEEEEEDSFKKEKNASSYSAIIGGINVKRNAKLTSCACRMKSRKREANLLRVIYKGVKCEDDD